MLCARILARIASAPQGLQRLSGVVEWKVSGDDCRSSFGRLWCYFSTTLSSGFLLVRIQGFVESIKQENFLSS